MNYTFESNIPPPRIVERRRYPFALLQPGESVLYECAPGADAQRARKAAYRVQDLKRWTITTRLEPKGIRVWRIA